MNKLSLPQEIYTKAALDATIAAFGKYAEFQVVSTETCFEVSFSNAICPDVLLANELGNYLIDYSYKMRAW